MLVTIFGTRLYLRNKHIFVWPSIFSISSCYRHLRFAIASQYKKLSYINNLPEFYACRFKGQRISRRWWKAFEIIKACFISVTMASCCIIFWMMDIVNLKKVISMVYLETNTIWPEKRFSKNSQMFACLIWLDLWIKLIIHFLSRTRFTMIVPLQERIEDPGCWSMINRLYLGPNSTMNLD